jgi:sigma-B regulation protein RsbU (phosphoserine phosphatase)
MDIPKIVEEAARAAAEAGSAASEKKIQAIVEGQIAKQMAGNEEALKTMAAALTREVGVRAKGANPPVDVEGRKIEVAIQKEGRVIGRANATLNLDRTLHAILGLARRDQGEIPFAIDRQGALYAPNTEDKGRLQTLGVERTAQVAAAGTPRRNGDWIIVARKAPGGIIFGIARPLADSLREIRRASVRNLGLGLLVIALAFVGIIPISHRMTQHLTSLTAGVRQLAGGNFATRVPVRSADEFGALATAFNQMAGDLERHQALVIGQERLRRELELSRLIQTEMLPRAALRSGPAEIAGISIPAREVGGDFFNYFVLPDGRLALLVGDVSGKGVSAALLMANIQATLRALLPHETDLARLADRLDREVDQNTPGSVYLTLFLGILEMDGHLLRYVNAGHNPQFILRGTGGIEQLGSTGMPIALYSGHGYREARVVLAAGDLLFFYTDGLVETENERGEMFGAERLQQMLSAQLPQDVDALLHQVEAQVVAFRGNAEPFDDATMMALRISAA